MLSVGSLFSGIGGFDLGLERTGGFYTAWFCEQDPFCRAVLEQHWPGRYIAEDVTELRAADVARVDVLCGGFPCQDISVAGRGEGLDGARSGLWSEYARLVGELRPSYVVVENVTALLARGLDRVLGDLASLGYDAEWDCLPASALGAPHQRDRIWLVAYPERHELRQQSEPISRREGPRLIGVDGEARPMADPDDAGRIERRRPEPVRAQQPAAERRGQDLEDAPSLGGGALGSQQPPAGLPDGPGGAGQRSGANVWAVEPDVGRVADGVPARVDRLRSLGNALVPQIATWIGERILAYEEGRLSDAA